MKTWEDEARFHHQVKVFSVTQVKVEITCHRQMRSGFILSPGLQLNAS